MQYSSVVLLAAFSAASVLAHGVITSIEGANGVTMPGLSVIDGTPRDCASPPCGSEADTSIIRKNELGTGKAFALGRTQGGGPVDAAKMVAAFVGDTAGNTTTAKAARGLLSNHAGGGSAGEGAKIPKGTVEGGVAAAAGAGASSGLPTCSDTGAVKMTFHQVNQDGAGPLSATIDPTSGGTDAAAFKAAQVTQNVPGSGVGGLSTTTATDFPVTIQMPVGIVCSGTVAGVSNVCVARLQNSALAGPFGGSVAFTQPPAAKKHAIEYNLSKRRFARLVRKSPASIQEAEGEFDVLLLGEVVLSGSMPSLGLREEED